MNLIYQFNSINTNLENKILLKSLYTKFFIRNKVDKITYVIENDFFFFNIDYKFLKKNIQFKEKKKIIYSISDSSSDKEKVLKKFSKIKSFNIDSNINLEFIETTNTNVKASKSKNLVGFSLFIKETMLTHKKYKNLQIHFFLKKQIFINFVKFQILFFKLFFRIFEARIPMFGFIVKVVKGGFLCMTNILTTQAYLSNSCFQNQDTICRSIDDFYTFFLITQTENPIENLNIFYSFCFFTQNDLSDTLAWNSLFFFQINLFFLYIFIVCQS